MKRRPVLLLVILVSATVISAVLWRRNAVESPKQAVTFATQAALPPNLQPALIEENKQTRPMTTRDLHDIAAKTRADLKNRPRDPELHLQMAVALSLSRHFDEAAAELENAARLAPRDARVQGSAGDFYLRFGDAQAALPHLQKAREAAPKDLDIVINLAKAHWARSEMDQTLSLLETASRLAGKSAALHEKLAGACTELPVRPNAVSEWREVLKLQPDNPLALQQLAFYDLDGGNPASAKAMLQKALSLEKQQAGLYSLMGTVYVSSAPTPANLNQAEAYLNQALELGNGSDSVTHYYLGKVFQRRGDLPKAAQQMETALAINPGYREAHYDLAQIYAAQKRVGDAARQRNAFQRIYQAQNRRNLVSRRCQTAPNDASLQLSLAQLFLEDKNPVAALPHLQKALELRPGWRTLQNQIIALHRAMGRPRRAIEIENSRRP